MSPWLKPRLAALLCGALLVGGAHLHAQNSGPPPKTRSEAATNFYRLLDLSRQNNRDGPDNSAQKLPLLGSIKRDQLSALGSGGARGVSEQAFGLFQILSTQAFTRPFDAKVVGKSGDETVVSMSPSTNALRREVVTVPEDGGFRVDIVATYGKWNNLSGLDADKALYRQIRFVSPALQKNGFVGAETLPKCQANQKQIALAVMQYVQDYDERMPPAREWIDVLQPYVRNSEQLFRCPASGENGYAFNQKLSRKPLAAINQAASTILIYESSNLDYNLFAPFTGRAYRHSQNNQSGMNIAFADGHVKWFARGQKAKLLIEPSAKTAGFIPISTSTQ